MQVRKVKDDIQSLVKQKLRELGVFQINITPELKNRINKLKDEELDLRRERKFTKEKGYELLDEIESINDALIKLPPIPEGDAEEAYYRKHKSTKPKSKRKIVKKVIKRKK